MICVVVIVVFFVLFVVFVVVVQEKFDFFGIYDVKMFMFFVCLMEFGNNFELIQEDVECIMCEVWE